MQVLNNTLKENNNSNANIYTNFCPVFTGKKICHIKISDNKTGYFYFETAIGKVVGPRG